MKEEGGVRKEKAKKGPRLERNPFVGLLLFQSNLELCSVALEVIRMAEAHIRKLIAPLFEQGDGLAFFHQALTAVRSNPSLNELTERLRAKQDVKWTVNSDVTSHGSHSLAGEHVGLEAGKSAIPVCASSLIKLQLDSSSGS